MKWKITIDKTKKEPELEILTPTITEEVRAIEEFIQNNIEGQLLVSKGDQVKAISFFQIVRVYSLDKRTIVEDELQKYYSNLSLTQLENILPANFTRISRSEFINLDFVDHLDLSFKGTVQVNLTTGDTTYLSRRRISEFKKKIGL